MSGRLDVGVVAKNAVRADGQGRAVLELIRALAERGHRVTVHAHRLAPDLIGAVDFRRLPPLPGPHLADDLAVASRASLRLRRRAHDVVVVLGHSALPRSPFVYYAQFSFRGWRSTWTRATRVPIRQRASAQAAALLEHALASRSTTLLVPAATVAAELVPEGHPRVAVVPNGVDLDEFRPTTTEARSEARRALRLPQAGHIVGFVGEYETGRKGLDTLLDAVALGPADEHLAVAGAGRPDQLAAAVAARGLAGRVHGLGFVATEAVYAAVDSVAVPSRYEPFSLVAVEAAACGLPVVVSARAGAAAHLDGTAELLADPDDAAALRGCLDRLRAALDGGSWRPATARGAAERLAWSCTAAEAAKVVEETAGLAERRG